jgi:hypothetical protein
MKWIKTPDAYLVDSYCNGKDSTQLGWVAELPNNGKMTYQAWICNGYDGATELGSNHKTPRLAQMAVERELIRRWFNFGWLVFDNNTYSLCVDGMFYKALKPKEKPAILARAKREFLNEL